MNIDLKYGDCLEIMPEIQDNSIDMILCDLPYAETGNKWDFIIDPKKLWSEYERIIKDDGAIVLTGTFKFGTQLYQQAPHLYKYDWVWQKDNGTNVMAAHYQPIREHEYIFVFGKNAVTFTPRQKYMKYNPQKTEGKPYSTGQGSKSPNWKGGRSENYKIENKDGSRFPKTIQYFCRDKDKLHPTQKPIALFEYLVKTYTNEGDLVLDNCMGSGTTAIACHNLSRHCIGIEKDFGYYEVAKKRLQDVQSVPLLFSV
jgi:site-specific DNA-methyltransferase (adenine-specific)